VLLTQDRGLLERRAVKEATKSRRLRVGRSRSCGPVYGTGAHARRIADLLRTARRARG
jgi:hypothetical protein